MYALALLVSHLCARRGETIKPQGYIQGDFVQCVFASDGPVDV